MLDNKFNQYRTEVCPEILKKPIGIKYRGLSRNRKNTFIGSVFKLITFDYIYIRFLNIFSNILTAFCWAYFIGPRNVGTWK